MVALMWVTLCRLRGKKNKKKHTAYIWATSRLRRSRPKVERRSAVSSWATLSFCLTEKKKTHKLPKTFDQYAQTASWHLSKIALLCGYGGWVRLTWLSQMPPRDVSVCLHWCFRTNTWQTGRTCSLDCAQPTLILRQYRGGCSLGLTLKSLGERGRLFKVNQREAEE